MSAFDPKRTLSDVRIRIKHRYQHEDDRGRSRWLANPPIRVIAAIHGSSYLLRATLRHPSRSALPPGTVVEGVPVIFHLRPTPVPLHFFLWRSPHRDLTVARGGTS